MSYIRYMLKSRWCLVVVGLLVMCFLSLPTKVHAALRLSLSSEDGGNSMRFGRIGRPSSHNKEMRVRVTSSDNKQYQVFQRVIDSFVNERGEPLDRAVLVAATLDGSNNAGTLYLSMEERMSYTDQLVYTSTSNGVSDGFTILYRVDPSRLTSSGKFLGKILYTVRSIGGGAQDEMVVNVFLDAVGELKVTLEGSSGRALVELDSQGLHQQRGYVELVLSGHVGGPLNIFQEMLNPLADELNTLLQGATVQFTVDADGPGTTRYRQGQLLEPFNRELLYTTQAREDRVRIILALEFSEYDLPQAGRFSGSLRYTVEYGQAQEVFDVDVVVNVAPVFEMKVQYPEEGLHFDNLLPGQTSQIREIEVEVQSNLGRPYVVHQQVTAWLSNEKGDEISGDFFAFRQTLEKKDRGKVRNVQFNPVPRQDVPVYLSDDKGLGTKFKVAYELTPDWQLSGGEYKAALTFSLNEK